MSREAELEAAARRFGEAWARGDVAVLDALLSPGYTHVDIYGQRLDRAQWLAYAAGRAGNATRVTVRDMATRHLGDVAIVTAINDLDGIGDAQSRGRDTCSIHVTQVWAWRDGCEQDGRWQDGRWQREAFHATIAAADEDTATKGRA